jgi:hypothetical protein
MELESRPTGEKDDTSGQLEHGLSQQEKELEGVAISIRGIKEKSYLIHSELHAQTT